LKSAQIGNMPGRVSARVSTASRLTNKSSTQTLASRRSTTSGIVVPEEGPDSLLRSQISGVFNDAQRTTAGHRKLVVGLRKIQETCINEPLNGRENLSEDDFNAEFARCVIRLLGVKKSESAGDRIVRFIGFFLRHASEKGR
jgi:condensin complex subunit 3